MMMVVQKSLGANFNLLLLERLCTSSHRSLSSPAETSPDHSSRPQPGIPPIDSKLQLLRREGFSPLHLKTLRTSLLFRVTSFDKLHSLISLLKAKGIAGALAAKLLTHRGVVRSTVASLESRLKFFEDLGMGESGLQRLVRRSSVLGLAVEHLQERIDFLEQIGLPNQHIQKMIFLYPQLLSLDIERKLERTVAFFERHGVDCHSLLKLLRVRPQVFGSSVDRYLTAKVEFMSNLGLDLDQKNGMRAFRFWFGISRELLDSRYDWLKLQGLSEDNVKKMVKTQPAILVLADDNLKLKFDYLVNVLHRDVQDVVKYPVYLCMNLEKRIMPRDTFLGQMDQKNGYVKRLPLRSLILPSDRLFERTYAPGYGKWKAATLNKAAAG